MSENAGKRLPEGMAGLAKGLAILEAFAPNSGRLTVSDAARLAGASRASARRCLLTLTELGYLEFDGKFFRPQPRLLSLSSAYSEGRSLPQVAQPILAAARDKLRESISLAILDNESAFFIARAEAERLVTTGISIGTRVALYCSATGRVLVAGWEDRQIKAYLDRTKFTARTKRTLVKKTDILGAIRKAQVEGYAVTDEELEIGLRSIAVPVTDSRGNLVGAMSASASSARVSLAQMISEFVPVLRDHAARLGRAL
ncbi:MAG: IclR family transcriptional regulator domain-containing protein [Bradyrhizobium sp.]